MLLLPKSHEANMQRGQRNPIRFQYTCNGFRHPCSGFLVQPKGRCKFNLIQILFLTLNPNICLACRTILQMSDLEPMTDASYRALARRRRSFCGQAGGRSD